MNVPSFTRSEYTVYMFECVHTLGLGDHFSPTATPTVHHRWAGPTRIARALSPGANTTWAKTDDGNIFLLYIVK